MKVSAPRIFGLPLVVLVGVDLLCVVWPLFSGWFDLPNRIADEILIFSVPAVFTLSICTLIAVLKAIKKQIRSDSWLLFIAFPTLIFSAFFLFGLARFWLLNDSTRGNEDTGKTNTGESGVGSENEIAVLSAWVSDGNTVPLSQPLLTNLRYSLLDGACCTAIPSGEMNWKCGHE